MCMKLLALIVFLVVSETAKAGYEVDCDGYNDAGENISGVCTDGQFEGYTDSGVLVSGDCEFGGGFDAYKEGTGEYFYGDCEGE